MDAQALYFYTLTNFMIPLIANFTLDECTRFQVSQHLQNTSTGLVATNWCCPSFLLLDSGKHSNLFLRMHFLRCSLIFDCSKFCRCGSSPPQRAVALAIANKPQSEPPLWCWTSTKRIWNRCSCVCRMANEVIVIKLSRRGCCHIHPQCQEDN